MKILGFLLIGVGLAALLSVVWPVIAIGAGVVILASTVSGRPEAKEGVGIWLTWPTFFRKGDQDPEPDEPDAGRVSV